MEKEALRARSGVQPWGAALSTLAQAGAACSAHQVAITQSTPSPGASHMTYISNPAQDDHHQDVPLV